MTIFAPVRFHKLPDIFVIRTASDVITYQRRNGTFNNNNGIRAPLLRAHARYGATHSRREMGGKPAGKNPFKTFA